MSTMRMKGAGNEDRALYIHDPDGNGIELYIDASDVWRTDPQTVATLEPLTL